MYELQIKSAQGWITYSRPIPLLAAKFFEADCLRWRLGLRLLLNGEVIHER